MLVALASAALGAACGRPSPDCATTPRDAADARALARTLADVRSAMKLPVHAADVDEAHSGPVRIRHDVAATGEVTIEDPSSGVSLRILSRLPTSELVSSAPIETSGYHVFAAGATGDGFVVRPRRDGVEDFYVMRSRLRELTFGAVLGERVATVRQIGRSLELLDAGGAPRLRMLPPYVVDSAGKRRDVDVDVVGCDVDRDPRGPWGRALTPPRARSCRIRLSFETVGLALPVVVDPAWVLTGSMLTARAEHSLVVLPSGQVLAAGGSGGSAAELFDPPSGSWASTQAAPASGGRAALLTNGSVLLVSGVYPHAAATWSPATGVWTTVAPPSAWHYSFELVSLDDGRALLSGGEPVSGEVFDPATNTWSSTAPEIDRVGAKAVKLLDGRVLLIGGAGASLQPCTSNPARTTSALYDPAANSWTVVDHAPVTFFGSAATRMQTGKVIVLGGQVCGTNSCFTEDCVDSLPQANLDQVVEFDPATNTFGALPPMAQMRALLTASTLSDGTVVAAGGTFDYYWSNPSANTEIFDPVTSTWTSGGLMTVPRLRHEAALLPGGQLLVAGGQSSAGATASAELYAGPAVVGSACTVPNDCAAGYCVDGFCCESTCPGLCVACAQWKTGLPNGQCQPVANGIDPDEECTDDGSPSCQQDGFCNGSGACELYPSANGCVPHPCTAGAECTSGHCVDGICCDTACEGFCQACTAAKKGAGSDGLCGAIEGGLDPDAECAADPPSTCQKSGFCDGAGQCQLYAPLTPCGSSICLNGVLEFALCNGTGTCLGDNASCAPYLSCADATSCATSCTTTLDCVLGYTCVDNECVNPGGNGGGGAGGVGEGGGAGAGGTGSSSSSSSSASGGGQSAACVPGQQTACACPGGAQGVQVCNDAGSGYGGCASCSDAGGTSGGTIGDDGGCAVGRLGAPGLPAWLLVAAAAAVAGFLRRGLGGARGRVGHHRTQRAIRFTRVGSPAAFGVRPRLARMRQCGPQPESVPTTAAPKL